MNDQAIDQFGTQFATAAMLSIVCLFRAKGIEPKTFSPEQLDKVCTLLKPECKVALHEFLNDGKVLFDSGNAGWLQKLMETKCLEAAQRAFENFQK